MQSSVYDKNPYEHTHPCGELIHVQSGDDYWAPHPKTGVFQPPPDDHNHVALETTTKESVVLEVKAFFRSLEPRGSRQTTLATILNLNSNKSIQILLYTRSVPAK